MSEISIKTTFLRMMDWGGKDVFKDSTRMDALNYILNHVEGSHNLRKVLLKSLPVSSKEQKDTEKELCKFISDNCGNTGEQNRLVVKATIEEFSSIVGRSVNWHRTMDRAFYQNPSEFCNRKQIQVPDRALLAGLKGLCLQWAHAIDCVTKLDETDEFSEGETQIDKSADLDELRDRKTALENAAYLIKTSTGQHSYNFQMEQRLSRLSKRGKELARSLRRALRFWQCLPDIDESIFIKISNQIDEKNEPDLLEVIAPLLIVRAAVSSGDSSWEIAPAHVPLKGKIEFLLYHSDTDIECRIFKGPPLEAKESGEKKPNPFSDQMHPLLKTIGLNPNPRQPDITLRFNRRNDPDKVLYVLGDAKNYKDSSNRAAIEDMLLYFMSYGKLNGINLQSIGTDSSETLESIDNDYPKAWVLPAGTMFFATPNQNKNKDKTFPRKLAENIALPIKSAEESNCDKNANYKDDETKAAQFIRDSGSTQSLPLVIAFDLESGHLGYEVDKEWKAPILSAWIDHLVAAAAKALTAGKGISLNELNTYEEPSSCQISSV
jgi:hypothetical protein